MRKTLTKLFFNIETTTYALALIALFAIAGSFIIYFNPEGYSLISTKPLFDWLYLNLRADTVWLFLIIMLFGFTAITGLICLFKDLINYRWFTAVFHLTFLLVLLAHLITAMYGFRVTGFILPQSKPETVPMPPPFKPLKLFLRDVNYQQTPFGVPVDIKAKVIYLDERTEKEGELSVNNPLKIGDLHIVLKDMGNYLNAVNLRLSDGKADEVIQLELGKTFTKENYKLDFLAHDEMFRQIKISYQEGDKKEFLYISPGSNITLSKKTYKVVAMSPIVLPAIVIDITYDPSLMLIFYASTLFTIAITVDGIKRFLKMPKF